MSKEKEQTRSIKDITHAFKPELKELNIYNIKHLKIIPDKTKKTTKYLQIKASIDAIGVIEPPVVLQDSKRKEYFTLLDGHLRITALKDLGVHSVICLVSSDDESFTYNKHVNRLTSIQEHQMILQAIRRGLPEEKIAKALNMDVKSIIARRDLLKGICQEAADMLKDKMVTMGVLNILKRLKPYRQIEAATLMNDTQTYTTNYARMIYAATPKAQLAKPEQPKNVKGLTEEEMARMEGEMQNLQREYQIIEECYGDNVLKLTIAKGYLAALLENSNITKYLTAYHPEIFSEFQVIANMKNLDS
jgi:hypothetical protein